MFSWTWHRETHLLLLSRWYTVTLNPPLRFPFWLYDRLRWAVPTLLGTHDRGVESRRPRYLRFRPWRHDWWRLNHLGFPAIIHRGGPLPWDPSRCQPPSSVDPSTKVLPFQRFRVSVVTTVVVILLPIKSTTSSSFKERDLGWIH